MQHKNKPARRQVSGGRANAHEKVDESQTDDSTLDEEYLPSSIPTLRAHLGAQLGLLATLAASILSTYWIAGYWRASLATHLPQLIGGQVFTVALIAGGIAFTGSFGRSWPLFTLVGLLAQVGFALTTNFCTGSAHNSVALLWLIGASALLIFTYARHVSLALLGIFTVYGSSLLLVQHLPLSGAICLFSLWTSFFSLIAILLKCRPLAWAGLYCAPVFFQAVYLGIMTRQGIQPTPIFIWALFALQVVQTMLFGTSIAAYTGSFNQRISPRQTWLYFPITLLGFTIFSRLLTPFGIEHILAFDALCLVLLYGLFIAVASRFLQAPLSDLTMVHVLTAVVSLHALRVIMLWIFEVPFSFGDHSLAMVHTIAALGGAFTSLALGISCRAFSDRALMTLWNRTWSRLAILLASGLSLYALRLLIAGSFWPFLPLRWLATCTLACAIALSYRFIWQWAIKPSNQLTSLSGRLVLAALFALQCTCWAVAAKSAAHGVILTLQAQSKLLHRDQGWFARR